MPNEILNLLMIRTDTEEEFKRIKEYCSSDKLKLDFQKILPIPHRVISNKLVVKDWCKKAWGTDRQPWDIEVWNSRTNPISANWCQTDIGVGFSFSTSRCSPVGLIRELSRQFPAAWFSLRAYNRDDPTLPREEWYHWGMEDLLGEKCDELLMKNGEILNKGQQLQEWYNDFGGIPLLTDKVIYLS